MYNGWMSNGPVNVIVIAESEDEARTLASEAFKKEGGERYGENYYNLKRGKVELLTDDITRTFVSEIDEG